MTNNTLPQRLLQEPNNWGLFYSKKTNLLVYAPPKCGSTSIFNALVDALEPGRVKQKFYSKEILDCLDIHPYVGQKYQPTLEELSQAMLDSGCLKVLVVRHPYSRFLSALASKYLIPDSPFCHELLGIDEKPLAINLTESPSDIEEYISVIANRMLLAPSVLTQQISHISPISNVIQSQDRVIFDSIVDMSQGEDKMEELRRTINNHLLEYGVCMGDIPRVNVSPFKLVLGDLSDEMQQKIVDFYKDECSFFGFDPTLGLCSSSSNLPLLNNSQAITLFYQIASRYYRFSEDVRDSQQSLKQEYDQLNTKTESLNQQLQEGANRLSNRIDFLEKRELELNTKIQESDEQKLPPRI